MRKRRSRDAVDALRAVGVSADGREITISVRTRYSAAERLYSVPIECFYDLIVDLRRLNSAGSNASRMREDAKQADRGSIDSR